MADFHPLVSCIVPIYNAEKYLAQGIDTLLAQTYDKLEIILVDDRSSDGSWDICRRYAERYPRVLAFRRRSNSGGPLRSRERGIHESHGEWLTFMDGDDYVQPGYIANLVAATEGGRYDMAVTGHSRLQPDGKTEEFLWKDYAQTTEERLAAFYHHFLTHDFWTDPTDTVGQNLIRANICKQTDLSRYSDTVYAEDTLMALAFLANSTHGVNFVDHHDFVWRQVEGSGSHGGFSSRANQAEFFQACLDIFHRQDIYGTVSGLSPLVSVIIPVYNVEPYLSDCLASVCSQTYRNLEIIVVNDGTTDKSQAIIDSYRRRDPRIIVLKQKNKGLNMARAAGVRVAKGNYIAFVDSDDAVHETYIQTLYESLLWNDVDISICGLKNFSDTKELSGLKSPIADHPTQTIKNKGGALAYFLGEMGSVPNIHQMTAWGKLYKAPIVKNTDWRLSNYQRHEDNLETLQWYSQADKGIVAMSAQLYYYRENPDSITQKPRLNVSPSGRALNYFQFVEELYEKTKEYVNDSSLDIAVLNNFAHTNRAQVERFFGRGQMDNASMESATENWNKIINEYNQQVGNRDNIIRQQAAELDGVYASVSWRLTVPLRILKKLLVRRK